ncbi:MAG: hypothetical protein H6992_04650 [Pseudomonadales bacterium]|nr:hypothetical protein [Pseudomonadales bacterium]
MSVPVAKDGSFFNAACKREKGYAVGRKGEETYYENFTKALEALRAMPGPYWRRPSVKTGLHGIVRGVGWTAKTPKELGLEI